MKRLNRLILGVTLATGISLAAVPDLVAQSQPSAYRGSRSELDFALAYTAQSSQTTGGNSFWMQGGNAQIVGTFYHGLGVVADVTATRASKINGTNVNLTLVATTFGPRYTWVLPARPGSSHRLRLFGETTGGIVNGLDSVFPDPAGAQSNAEGTALQVGGGADLTLSKHLALRLIQAHWVRSWMPNGYTGAQNNFTTGAGIVFRLP